MKTFEIKTWLGSNREVIIAKHNEMTSHQFYNGCTLKDFMLQIMNTYVVNNVRSEKRAEKMLAETIEYCFYKNTRIGVINDLDANMKNKYQGTAYMAMV